MSKLQTVAEVQATVHVIQARLEVPEYEPINLDVMRGMGYDVWVGHLEHEQYERCIKDGVPMIGRQEGNTWGNVFRFSEAKPVEHK